MKNQCPFTNDLEATAQGLMLKANHLDSLVDEMAGGEASSMDAWKDSTGRMALLWGIADKLRDEASAIMGAIS